MNTIYFACDTESQVICLLLKATQVAEDTFRTKSNSLCFADRFDQEIVSLLLKAIEQAGFFREDGIDSFLWQIFRQHCSPLIESGSTMRMKLRLIKFAGKETLSEQLHVRTCSACPPNDFENLELHEWDNVVCDEGRVKCFGTKLCSLFQHPAQKGIVEYPVDQGGEPFF